MVAAEADTRYEQIRSLKGPDRSLGRLPGAVHQGVVTLCRPMF